MSVTKNRTCGKLMGIAGRGTYKNPFPNVSPSSHQHRDSEKARRSFDPRASKCVRIGLLMRIGRDSQMRVCCWIVCQCVLHQDDHKRIFAALQPNGTTSAQNHRSRGAAGSAVDALAAPHPYSHMAIISNSLGLFYAWLLSHREQQRAILFRTVV